MLLNSNPEQIIWHLPLKEKRCNFILYMFDKKKNNKTTKSAVNKATLFTNAKDYSKDPFVVKKVEASKKIVEKYGFPKELIAD